MTRTTPKTHMPILPALLSLSFASSAEGAAVTIERSPGEGPLRSTGTARSLQRQEAGPGDRAATTVRHSRHRRGAGEGAPARCGSALSCQEKDGARVLELPAGLGRRGVGQAP